MKKRDCLLIFLTGVLLTLSYPQVDLEFLAWFALIPFFYSLRDQDPLSCLFRGTLTGLLFFLGVLYWVVVAVHTYGKISLVLSILILLLLIVYLSLFWGAFAMIFRLVEQRMGSRGLILTPVFWVALEHLRSFLLTGFPWANLGHSQYLNLPFIQVAEITGVYGLSFTVLLVNVTLYLVLRQWPDQRFPYREALIAALILIGTLVYGYVRIDFVEKQTQRQQALSVGLAQGNIDQAVKWNEAFQKETLERYERLSLRLAEGKPDLIVWPETATPFFFQDAKEYGPLILGIPVKADTFLLFGSPSYKIEGRKVNHYNSAYLVSPSGNIAGRYDKIHLVPFGEYVPLGEILKLGSLGEGIGDFKPGEEVVTLSLPRGRFGVLICFEIIFPDLCRRFVDRGANFLVTLTNDAWFGRTAAPHQHLAIAAFRAVENRVYIARAANTGFSAFIDPAGRILRRSRLFTEESLSGTIRLSDQKTFYTRYGDVFAWICSGLSILLLGYFFFDGRKRQG